MTSAVLGRTAGQAGGEETFRICRNMWDEIVLVDTDAVVRRSRMCSRTRAPSSEPAGALAIAGAKLYAKREQLKGETLIPIACGANMNFDRLRFVAERAEIGEKREAILAVTIPRRRAASASSVRCWQAQHHRIQLMAKKNASAFSTIRSTARFPPPEPHCSKTPATRTYRDGSRAGARPRAPARFDVRSCG